MTKKLKIGIIGCGMIARENHIPGLLKNADRWEIAGLYDIVPKKAGVLAADFELKNVVLHDSLEALLNSGIDAVVVATPNDTHKHLACTALNAGKHVLVEKPMAVDLKEADEMIRLAGTKGLILQVNQSIHFSPAYTAIRNAVANGMIGTPLHIRCLRAHTDTPDVSWSPGASWFVQKKHHGGIVLDIAVHMANFMDWAFGHVKQVNAVTRTLKPGIDVVDTATAMFRFENGATGVLELSWQSPLSAGMLEIFGTKGIVRMGDSCPKPSFFPAGCKGSVELELPEVKNTHYYFHESVVTGSYDNNPSSWQVGRDALALCAAILESGEKNKEVTPSY